MFILTYGIFYAVFSRISAKTFWSSEISRGKKIDLWVKKCFLSKNVLEPKFRCKTHLQALKDSFPVRFVIFGRFRPIYRHFIFLKKVDFGHFSMWPILAENSAENGRTHESWPEMCSPGSGDAFSSPKHLPTTSRSKNNQK